MLADLLRVCLPVMTFMQFLQSWSCLKCHERSLTDMDCDVQLSVSSLEKWFTGFHRYFMKMFMVPRGWILTTIEMPDHEVVKCIEKIIFTHSWCPDDESKWSPVFPSWKHQQIKVFTHVSIYWWIRVNIGDILRRCVVMIFGDPLTFPLAPVRHFCGFKWKVSTAVKKIAMKF